GAAGAGELDAVELEQELVGPNRAVEGPDGRPRRGVVAEGAEAVVGDVHAADVQVAPLDAHGAVELDRDLVEVRPRQRRSRRRGRAAAGGNAVAVVAKDLIDRVEERGAPRGAADE